MKYLSDYIRDEQTKVFNNFGAFFAFSTEQFNEQKKDNVTYVNLGMGMLCPKENYKELKKELDEVYKKGIEQDIKENGIKAIIERELNNYECFYTWDTSDAINSLKDYEITSETIQKEFDRLKVLPKYSDEY